MIYSCLGFWHFAVPTNVFVWRLVCFRLSSTGGEGLLRFNSIPPLTLAHKCTMTNFGSNISYRINWLNCVKGALYHYCKKWVHSPPYPLQSNKDYPKILFFYKNISHSQKSTFLDNTKIQKNLTVQSDFTVGRPKAVLCFTAVLAQVFI